MISGERHLLLDLLYMLLRRSGRIILTAALCTLAGLTFNAAQSPRYTATVRLVAAPGPDGSGRAARNQVELLRDPGLVRRVLPQLLARRPTVQPGLPGQAAAGWRLWPTAAENDADFALRVSQALRVRPVDDTDVVDLSFTWPDRVFAAAALNTIVAGYQRTGADAAGAADAMHQAQTRVDAAEADLAAVDRRLLAIPAGLDADAARAERGRIEARLAQARATADAVRLDRALAQRRLETMEQAFRSGAWVDGADADASGSAPLAAGFTALLEKRQSLLSDGKADSAAMRALDREIARARAQSFATARQIEAGRVGALDDRLASLAGGIADDEAALHALDRDAAETELLTLSRPAKAGQVEAARHVLADTRARAAAAAQPGAGARIVSEAVPPPVADWPGPFAVIRLSALLGLVAGVGSAAWAEARRRTIDRVEDVSRLLGIEVLARLDEVKVAQLR